MLRGSWFFHLPVGIAVIFYFCFGLIWSVNCHKVNRRQTVEDLLSNTRSDQAAFPLVRATSNQDPSVFDIYQPLRDPSLVGRLQGNATPGITYPTLTTTVKTNFTCRGLKGPGWYADIEAGCQQYHRCYSELRSTTFICPPGTLFSQETLICDFWYNVNCAAAKGLYEYANSRLYKFGVPLHGDTKWTPPPVTAAPPLLVRVEVTGRSATLPTTRRIIPMAPMRMIQDVLSTRPAVQPASTEAPVTSAPLIQAQSFILAAGRSYEFNASSAGLAQASAIVDNALAQTTRNTSSSSNTSGQICVIVIQIPHINHQGPNASNYVTVNQSGVVSVSQYCRIQRTPAEVQLLQQQAQPGISYPVYTSVVATNFTCQGLKVPGWYEEPQTFCQQYYYCDEHGTATANLCSPSTLFNQATMTCDVWYNVVCNGLILYNSTTYGSLYLLHGQVTNGVVTSGTFHADQSQQVISQQPGGVIVVNNLGANSGTNVKNPQVVLSTGESTTEPVTARPVFIIQSSRSSKSTTTSRPTITPRTTTLTTTTEETTEKAVEATTEVVMLPESTVSTTSTVPSTTARRRSVIASFNLTSTWVGGSVQESNRSSYNTTVVSSPQNIVILQPVDNLPVSVSRSSTAVPIVIIPITAATPVAETEELTTLAPSAIVPPSLSDALTGNMVAHNGSISGVLDRSDVLVFKPVTSDVTVSSKMTTLADFTTDKNTVPSATAPSIPILAIKPSERPSTTVATNLDIVKVQQSLSGSAASEGENTMETLPTTVKPVVVPFVAGNNSKPYIIATLVSVPASDMSQFLALLNMTTTPTLKPGVNVSLPSTLASNDLVLPGSTQNMTIMVLQKTENNSSVNGVTKNDTENLKNEPEEPDLSYVTIISTVKPSTTSVPNGDVSDGEEAVVTPVIFPDTATTGTPTTTSRRIIVGAGRPRPTWWSPPTSTPAVLRVPVTTTSPTNSTVIPFKIDDRAAEFRRPTTRVVTTVPITTRRLAVSLPSIVMSPIFVNGSSNIFSNFTSTDEDTTNDEDTNQEETSTVASKTRSTSSNKVITTSTANSLKILARLSPVSQIQIGAANVTSGASQTLNGQVSSMKQPPFTSNVTVRAGGSSFGSRGTTQRVPVTTTVAPVGSRARVTWWVPKAASLSVTRARIATTASAGTLFAEASASRPTATVTQPSTTFNIVTTTPTEQVLVPLVVDGEVATVQNVSDRADNNRAGAVSLVPLTTQDQGVNETTLLPPLVPLPTSYNQTALVVFGEKSGDLSQAAALLHRTELSNNTQAVLLQAISLVNEGGENGSSAGLGLSDTQAIPTATQSGLVLPSIVVVPIFVNGSSSITSISSSSSNSTDGGMIDGGIVNQEVISASKNKTSSTVETLNGLLTALNATSIAAVSQLASSSESPIGIINTSAATVTDFNDLAAVQNDTFSLSSNQAASVILPSSSSNVTTTVGGVSSINNSRIQTTNTTVGDVVIISGANGSTARVSLTTTTPPSRSKAKVTWWVPQGVDQSATKPRVTTISGTLTAVTSATRPSAAAVQPSTATRSTIIAQNQFVAIPIANVVVATNQNVSDTISNNHEEAISSVPGGTLDEQKTPAPPLPSLVPLPTALGQTALVGFGDTQGNLSQAVAVLHRTELSNSSVNGAPGAFFVSASLPNETTLTKTQLGEDSVPIQIPIISSSNLFLTATVPPTIDLDASNSTESGVGYRTIRYLEHRLLVRMGPFHSQTTSNETTSLATNATDVSDLPEVEISGTSTIAVPLQFRQLRRLL